MTSMRITFVIIILFVIHEKIVEGQHIDEIYLIKDLLKINQEKNIGVTAFLCWNKEDRLKLFNELIKNNYSTSVYDLQDKNIDFVYPDFKQIYIVDLDCEYTYMLLKKANVQQLFRPYFSWFLLTNKLKNDEIPLEKIFNLNIYSNSDVILIQKMQNDRYVFKEIYKVFDNANNNVNEITEWTKLGKFGDYKQRILGNDRRDFHGQTIGVGIIILENDTINHLDDYRFKHTDSVTKVNYILVKHLLDYVNASYMIHITDSWGYFNKTTKTYNGMIGDLQKNKYEVGGTAMFITRERVSVVDFLAMTSPTKIRFVFRQPPLSYEQNIFILPFTKQLWIYSFILVVLAALLLYSTVCGQWDEQKVSENPRELGKSLPDCVMIIFGAVSQQGSTTEPKNSSGKIIMIFIFIALMFLYVSYSANIVALIQSPATNIQTLEDLLESRMKLGSDDTVYNRHYLTTATEPIRKAIYERKIAPGGQKPHFLPLEEGVKLIRNGFYAFHMELGRGYKIVSDTFYESEKCGIQEIKYLDTDDTYLTIKKNSTFREIFNLGMRKIRESGLQQREISKIYTNKPECHSAGGSFLSVGLIDSYSAFLFLLAGIAIASVILIIEIFVNKACQQHISCKFIK